MRQVSIHNKKSGLRSEVTLRNQKELQDSILKKKIKSEFQKQDVQGRFLNLVKALKLSVL